MSVGVKPAVRDLGLPLSAGVCLTCDVTKRVKLSAGVSEREANNREQLKLNRLHFDNRLQELTRT